MVTNQRQIEILNIINEKGNVNVEDLAEQLQVSKMTIRRDLDKLQDENLLRRTHGGAIISRVLLNEIAYAEKTGEMAHEKSCIATRAVTLVKKHTTLFLDAGTTTYEIARRLPKSGLIVITNDLRISTLLMTTENEVIFLGGTILKETGSVTDHYAQYMLNSLNIDISFLGTSSVDEDFYLCTPEKDRQAMKQIAFDRSKKNVLVVDSTKFYSRSLYKILHVNDFDLVISDFSPKNFEETIFDKSKYIYASCEENEVEKDD